MGANFVPSYANLAMGLWELEYVSDKNPFAFQAVYYGHYTDNIITHYGDHLYPRHRPRKIGLSGSGDLP